MPKHPHAHAPSPIGSLPWLGIVAPLVVFWVACLYFLSPLPVLDDYDAVLRYVNLLHQAPTPAARLGMVLFHQHNEYKPIWANAVIAAQYGLQGRVDCTVLSLLGDMQVMLLAWLLWKCFAPADVDRGRRMALFVPLALVVFQLNYAETLNWPMPGLQNVGVVTFALMAMWLVTRPERGSFAGACMAMVLSIASSSNGFLVYPIGLLLLGQQRRWLRMAPWTILLAVCASVYVTRYVRPPPSTAKSALQPAGHTVAFILSFLGSAGGVALPVVRYGSVLLGIAIVAVVVIAAVKRYHRVNPAICGFALFLLITAPGVAVTRAWLGYDQSLSGRYKLYSDMLIACVYCFSLHAWAERPGFQQKRLHRWTLAAACLFFVIGTAFGLRAMRTRHRGLDEGIALYKASGGTQGPVLIPAGESTEQQAILSDMDARFRQTLREAIHEGVYRLP